VSPRLLLLPALLLAWALTPTVAQAAPLTLGSYAYYQPVADDPDYAGRVVVVLRTDEALPLFPDRAPRAQASLGGIRTFGYTISRRLFCYGYALDVRKGGLGIGDRVRVRIGKDGVVLDRRLEIRRRAADLPRGQRLGCGDDPASKVVLFNLTRNPLVEPGRFFFSANAGPYLKGIRWTGWGADTATGTGTYVSDCPSCGEPESYPVRVTASQLTTCRPYGARAYDNIAYERTDPPEGVDEGGGIDGLAAAFC
jgi:hypothetical protein